MQTLDIGEYTIRVSQWYDATGAPADPSDITLTITKPDGTEIIADKGDMFATSSDGSTVDDIWSYGTMVDQDGAWRVQWTGTVDGAPIVHAPEVFLVGASNTDTGGLCEPWCTWDDVLACTTTDFSSLTVPQQEQMIDLASGVLYDLSKRYYPGICEKRRSLCLACSLCGRAWCSCDRHDSIDLGGRMPIYGAWDVVVAGETLAPSLYTVLDHRYLTRLDGNFWPHTSDLTDPGAFAVSYAYGRKPPPGGVAAAAVFTRELAKACAGQACEIPQRVNTIAREGMTYVLLDSMQMIADGRTGIGSVDTWLVSDAIGRKARPGLFAPGAHGLRRA